MKIEMKGINKSFGSNQVLKDAGFVLEDGEVHALMGENGAGKSTLMKILSGVYTRDEGTMEIFGKSYDDLTPKQAQEAGVAIIHQELNMCRHLTVTENMFLGREVKGGLSLNNAKMRKEAKRVLDDLRIDISPDQIVGDLPVSKQQMVEIAKALSIDARILIMDEPTSSLTAKEIDDLFRIIRKLRDEGRGIVYISHRLEELAHIVDRVTIMRDGQYITDGNFKDMDMDYIIKNMVGREIKEKFPRVECRKGKKIFEVKNLNAGKMVRDINFSLYEGEIVGFAGLMGAGRTETTRAIFGVDPKVAFLSYSTLGSGKGEDVDKMRNACEKAKALMPDTPIGGEFQFDAAVSPAVAKTKHITDAVGGHANTFIFPDINAGNIGYKIAQRLGGFEAYGPILQGLNAPINDLSRGCNADDVYKMAIITAGMA